MVMSGTTNIGPWMPWPWTVRYPSTWYHPVKASVVIANATQLAALNAEWSPTAGMADIRRTAIDADATYNAAMNVLNNVVMGVAPPAGQNLINLYSASWQQMLNTGGPLGATPGAIATAGQNPADIQAGEMPPTMITRPPA